MSIHIDVSALVKSVEDHLVANKTQVEAPLVANKTQIGFPWRDISQLFSSLETTLTGRTKFFDLIKQLIWLPLMFLWMGIKEIAKRILFWGIFFYMLLFFGAWIAGNAGISTAQSSKIVILVAMGLPLFLSFFALPSVYGDSGVPEEAVKFVGKKLRTHNFSSVKKIEQLQKVVKQFEDRAKSRLMLLKGISGLFWSALIFVASKSFETPVTYSADNIITFMLLGVVTVFIYLCVFAYDAAVRKLFRTIDFGCIDCAYGIERMESRRVIGRKNSGRMR